MPCIRVLPFAVFGVVGNDDDTNDNINNKKMFYLYNNIKACAVILS